MCVYSESSRCATIALCVLAHLTTDPVAAVLAGSREVVVVVCVWWWWWWGGGAI